MNCNKRGYYDIFVNTCSLHPLRPAVKVYENGHYKSYSYSELYGVCEYISQNLQQLSCPKGVIGLITERNFIVPSLVAAVHKQCCSFMFLDISKDLVSIIKERKLLIVLAIGCIDNVISKIGCKQPEKSINIFNHTINFFYYAQNNTDVCKNTSVDLVEHAYIAMTSGSTGEPKHIQVSMQSILPNIDDLTKLFCVTKEDIIYFCTPLTFDPSMVEILLACSNGACLLIAPENPEILFSVNKKESITFWQTTPSKFFQLTNTKLSKIVLGDESTLRVLALGGEPLNGIKQLKEMKSTNNITKIYTLYGVTEMSCWACAAELDLEKVETDKEIPLGHCLSETEIMVKPTVENKKIGKIILHSRTRKCVLLNRSNTKNEELHSLKWIDTGDIGEVKNGIIYYRGRQDDIIKRFGNKVNLQVIESTIMQCPKVKACSCLWLPKPMLLVVYYSSEYNSTQELSDFLKCKLDDRHWPDKIIRVNNLPITIHGKISKQALHKMFKKNQLADTYEKSYELTLLNAIKEVLNKSYTYDAIKDKDFISIGGTSFLAVSMCNKLSQKSPVFGNTILPLLLDPNVTIDKALNTFKGSVSSGKINQANKKNKRIKLNTVAKYIDSTPPRQSTSVSSQEPIEFCVLWSYDTGKCVDASPSLFQCGFNLYVTVGSHSGRIIVADARTGNIEGLLNLNSRVEASVFCHCNELSAPRGVVGTYDGTVVCFSLEDCKLLWKINVGSMIKSKATYCKGYIYIGSYDGNVRCIDIMTGIVNNVIQFAEQAISADLVLAKRDFIVVCTLSGVFGSVHCQSNSVVWRGALSSPIFSTPVLFDDDKYAVIAEVSGELHCRSVENGIKLWRCQVARGNIFSSLHMKENGKMRWQIFFGCHDNHVYCINVKSFQPSLNWRYGLQSPIYSTPGIMNNKYVISASNNGQITVINMESGDLVSEYALPNEVFSSPAVWGDYIFIGCRNDHVYALRFSLG